MKNKYIIAFLLSLPLFIFLIYIASTRSIVHDEAFTYLHMVNGSSVLDILTFKIDIANNHILNSLAIKVIQRLVSIRSEFYMRLPNVLAFIIFTFSSFKITEHLFKSKKAQLLSFLLLITNIYVFEFFGLARGYGLALSFMMASIFSYLEYTKATATRKTLWLYLTLSLASLSTLSNTVSLNYYLSLVLILCVYEFFTRKQKDLLSDLIVIVKKLFFPIALSLFLLIPTVISIIKLRRRGGLNYGTKDFISGMIGSLIKGSITYNINHANIFLVSVLTIIFFVLILLFIVYYFLKKKNLTLSHFLLFLVLYISCLSIVAQFILLKTPMLIGRTGLFLIPVSMVTFFIFLSVITNYAKLRNVIYVLLALLCLLASVNFLFYSRNKCTLEWDFDCNDRQVFDYLSSTNEKTVYVTWIYYPSQAFYNSIHHSGLNILTIEDIDISKMSGYIYYYNGKENHKIHKLDLSKYNLVKEYVNGGLLLHTK